MKIRMGFVSNSSSSSFIISVAENQFDVFYMLKDCLDFDRIFDDVDSLKGYIVSNYGLRGETYEDVMAANHFTWVQPAISSIEQGGTVATLYPDYSDCVTPKICNKFFTVLSEDC